jgi:hypothetical protein
MLNMTFDKKFKNIIKNNEPLFDLGASFASLGCVMGNTGPGAINSGGGSNSVKLVKLL